jgi:hypothetical protein
MRWIVVFNPILVIFLMAVHRLSGDPTLETQHQLHLPQHEELHSQNAAMLLRNSSGNSGA